MPCNQVILNRVEISVSNIDLLAIALEIVRAENPGFVFGGYSARDLAERIVKAGSISVPEGQEYLVDIIKQEYSRQAVLFTARKNNWQVKVDVKNKNKMYATRRA